jgi:hypothetical protein
LRLADSVAPGVLGEACSPASVILLSRERDDLRAELADTRSYLIGTLGREEALEAALAGTTAELADALGRREGLKDRRRSSVDPGELVLEHRLGFGRRRGDLCGPTCQCGTEAEDEDEAYALALRVFRVAEEPDPVDDSSTPAL